MIFIEFDLSVKLNYAINLIHINRMNETLVLSMKRNIGELPVACGMLEQGIRR